MGKKMNIEKIPELGLYPKISKENFVYLATLIAFCFSFSKWGTDNCDIRLFLASLVFVFGIVVLMSVGNKKGYKRV